ncbi:MAG: dihydroorotate dehydrogenase electron transfer subunit [Candidatus Omnitrophota bacterium]
MHVRIEDGNLLLLRRPFGIHKADSGNIGILYKVVGKGTAILSNKVSGSHLDIIGPLGNGFDITSIASPRLRPEQNNNNNNAIEGGYPEPILIAGGIGVAPLVFLAILISRLNPNNIPLVFLGTKTKKDILCIEEFKNLGCNIKIATEDGSRGCKGKITKLLKEDLCPAGRQRMKEIFACGPKPMLEEIGLISQTYNIPAQLCFEETIGCGIGACMGCVIETVRGYRRICRDGPVFWAHEIAG